MNRQEFVQVMIPVAQYYTKELTDSLIKIYYAQASELSVEAFEYLINMHMKDPDQGRFFPTFAHLIAQGGTEDDIKVEAKKIFDNNPCIDGIGSYQAKLESIDKRNARRSAYIRSYVSEWKECTSLEKLAFSKRIPDNIKGLIKNDLGLLEVTK